IGGYGEGGSLTTGHSWPEEKYYDKYIYGTNDLEYTRGHFGDATFEVGPFKELIYANNEKRPINSWYANQGLFIYNVYSWFGRGGAYNLGTESGIFAFGHAFGAIGDHLGFRVILMP
ncbi:MAG: hypothetical protein HFG48_02800, partial [Bacilli bacterium]|nr:hypothetical protein [Bacilli bacterium]